MAEAIGFLAIAENLVEDARRQLEALLRRRRNSILGALPCQTAAGLTAAQRVLLDYLVPYTCRGSAAQLRTVLAALAEEESPYGDRLPAPVPTRTSTDDAQADRTPADEELEGKDGGRSPVPCCHVTVLRSTIGLDNEWCASNADNLVSSAANSTPQNERKGPVMPQLAPNRQGEEGGVENVEFLVNLPCPVTGWRLLHFAVLSGHCGVVKLLLSLKAKVDANSGRRIAVKVACNQQEVSTALTMAIAMQRDDIIEYLVQAGAAVKPSVWGLCVSMIHPSYKAETYVRLLAALSDGQRNRIPLSIALQLARISHFTSSFLKLCSTVDMCFWDWDMFADEQNHIIMMEFETCCVLLRQQPQSSSELVCKGLFLQALLLILVMYPDFGGDRSPLQISLFHLLVEEGANPLGWSCAQFLAMSRVREQLTTPVPDRIEYWSYVEFYGSLSSLWRYYKLQFCRVCSPQAGDSANDGWGDGESVVAAATSDNYSQSCDGINQHQWQQVLRVCCEDHNIMDQLSLPSCLHPAVLRYSRIGGDFEDGLLLELLAAGSGVTRVQSVSDIPYVESRLHYDVAHCSALATATPNRCYATVRQCTASWGSLRSLQALARDVILMELVQHDCILLVVNTLPLPRRVQHYLLSNV